jgi:hypothetical protein
MAKVLYLDKVGNQLVERKDGAVGLRGKGKKMVTPSEFKSWVKENKMGKNIKFKKDGSLWVSDKLLKGK